MKVIWALDRDLVRTTSPGSTVSFSLEGNGGQFAAFQEIHPTLQLGQTAHDLGPGNG